MRKLTIEDRTMLQYFWDEKGDIERYCYFKELKPEIKKELPKLDPVEAFDDEVPF